ncbi:hypothetical protein FBU59_000136 [Linderina macrospora]|uniref:Uncharacterized protein n=1 Tax=Linderina macrospora TaxID=4868 RepID=A0ACC1JI06_9FUNG|nr:hypothetical protein FBU59_000136 [Linderina macrospora]
MYKVFLKGKGIYGCPECGSHFVEKDKILSKDFTGQYGRAILFDKLVNVVAGEAEQRKMTTGVFIVQDVACMECDRYVGWTYVKAYSPDQAFKEGKFILERLRVCDVTRELKR